MREILALRHRQAGQAAAGQPAGRPAGAGGVVAGDPAPADRRAALQRPRLAGRPVRRARRPSTGWRGSAPLPFDAARARALLAEAGYPPGLPADPAWAERLLPVGRQPAAGDRPGLLPHRRRGAGADPAAGEPVHPGDQPRLLDVHDLLQQLHLAHSAAQRGDDAQCRARPRRLQPAALFQPGGGRAAGPGADDDGRGAAARPDPAGDARAAGGQGR